MGGIFCLEYPRERKCSFRKLQIFISQTTDSHFANYRFPFRKLQILISQTTDSHFANYRFSFRKLQISISQSTDFHFANYRFPFRFVPFRFANYSKPVLFGSVSQRSYVAESLRSRLQLISLQSEKINLNTFGESKFRKQTQIQKAEPSEDDVLANSVKRFWDTESVGISDITANDEELFEIDVRRKGNCYEVKFPWKENTQPSSNGYQLSESRLRSLHHKLRKEASLLAEYDAIIQEQMKSGIVEKVPDEYLTNQETSQNYYLPHMAVII